MKTFEVIDHNASATEGYRYTIRSYDEQKKLLRETHHFTRRATKHEEDRLEVAGFVNVSKHQEVA